MDNTRQENARSETLHVSVPATCANLGAGFDVLGLAVELHNSFRLSHSEQTSITLAGYGEALPVDRSNLFFESFAHLFAAAGQPTPAVRIEMKLSVPPGRGLGSSATAVVGGLVAANTLLGLPFTNDELLVHAVQLEHGRHADNVAPALLGGLVANVVQGEDVISVKVPFPDDLKAVLFIPDFDMDTVQGRSLMPEQYARADVVFNTSRVALFIAAITQKRYDLLRVAMEDRMHQPYRAQIFPAMPRLIEAALDHGAAGACLSGGGSSILALAHDHWNQIATGMREAASEAGLTGKTAVLQIDHEGAQATWEDEP